MQTWHPRKVIIVAYTTLLAMGLLCISPPVFGIEFKLREFFQNKVDTSDEFIKSFNEKADGLVNVSAGLVSLLTRKGFSALEKRTGLSAQNQLYREGKKIIWRKSVLGWASSKEQRTLPQGRCLCLLI